MNTNFNGLNQMGDKFASASRQFADTAAQVNRLALENAEQVFGLQLATFEQNVNAAFAFWGELSQARDMDGLKSVLPKGAQVARETFERSLSTGQDVLGRTIKTNEAIGQIAKGQFEQSTAQVKSAAEQVGTQVNDAANQFNKASGKTSK